MLAIDLTGKRALVAGVSDDAGFGFAIAKALAEAGASICVGSWPPALGIFTKLIERGKMAESSRLSDGRTLEFERIYPLDAAFDKLDDAPAEMAFTLTPQRRPASKASVRVSASRAALAEDMPPP